MSNLKFLINTVINDVHLLSYFKLLYIKEQVMCIIRDRVGTGMRYKYDKDL